MRRITIIITAIAAALLLVSCGSDDGDAATADEADTTTTSTTEPATETVRVRVRGEILFSGCTAAMDRSGLEVGNDRRVTLEDGSGKTLGVGTFQLSRGADSCDWTATIDDVPGDADFYTVVAGAELATLSAAEMERNRWNVMADININGNVNVIVR